MNYRQLLVTLCFMIGICLLFFYASQKWITGAWMQLALNPEINDVLADSIVNQKRLAHLEPEKESEYREQFDRTQALLAHMEVLQSSRQYLLNRYQTVLFSLFGLSLLSVAGVQLWQQRRLARRLLGLRHNLERLAAGEPVDFDRRRHDLLGRIELMIESTSQVMGKRLKQLELLERWQESSRRVAHEIRTPLTAIQLELKKFAQACQARCTDFDGLGKRSVESIHEELGRLNDFTDQFTAFAKIRKPVVKREDLGRFLKEFCESYLSVWPHMKLVREGSSDQGVDVGMDRRMIRQVLVNLCSNSASALGTVPGSITFRLLKEKDRVVLVVRDTGPGIPDSLKSRLFEPYVTTKPVGEGMGLGLAIAKKIMLDHQGDLILSRTDSTGTEFHMVLPVSEEKARPRPA